MKSYIILGVPFAIVMGLVAWAGTASANHRVQTDGDGGPAYVCPDCDNSPSDDADGRTQPPAPDADPVVTSPPVDDRDGGDPEPSRSTGGTDGRNGDDRDYSGQNNGR